MSARPCPVELTGCPGVDAPITNVTAEAPDPLLFAGIVWDNYDPHAPPPLGDGPHVRTDCSSLQSTIASYNPIIYATTQLMANLQALAISLGCDWPPSGDQTFTNDEQTATVYCPEGTAFTYTVAAGTVVSPPMDPELGAAFVAWANAWASAYAYQQASALMDCVAPDTDTPPEPGPDKPTIPAGAGILPGPVWMCLGETIFHRYRVSGRGASSYDITISDGALPPGTTFVQDGPRTGYITGTPTTPGEYNFTIQAVSTTVPSLTLTVQDYIFVMGITNCDSLPDAQTGTAYGPETILATGGTSPYTFASSNLPTGFSLTSAGVLTSDTSTVDGDYTFDVTLTDANGGECVQTCSISVVTACADWTQLAWQVASQTNGSFSPSNTTGDSFSVVVLAGVSNVGNQGLITYNGTGCNCNIHLVYAGGVIPGTGNCIVSAMQVAPFIALNCWVGFTPRASGTYDVLFSLPNTGGVPLQYRILVSFPSGSGPLTLSGTISNV